jgi:1,4-alpha-glucan branching enzyme
VRKSSAAAIRGGKKVRFQMAAPAGSEVYLVGTFNNWDAKAIRLQNGSANGEYSATLLLAPGRYEYKYIINGDWRTDPGCADAVANAYGSKNSVLQVQ